MRIVQTFWTGGRNPLEYSFGWLRPEYNLMSWALSCLCLRKHYDKVALYTDRQGKHVLIDLLHLPYTEVNVVYDETLCLPQHWSYPKIKTYSLQTEPFLHVDGDVFLSKPVPEEIANAPIIAQNREIGTGYYRGMMDKFLRETSIILPKYAEEGLKEDAIASYNMGIFGGSDLIYIKGYCEEALTLCENNKPLCLNGNFNLLFEQILFAYKVKKDNQLVKTLFQKVYKDNGYSTSEFCQLGKFEENGYFHLIGGHKRDREITSSLEETLLILFPDYYKLIVPLFPYCCIRRGASGTICVPLMIADEPIKSYIEFLNKAEDDWHTLSWEKLFEMETIRIKGWSLSFHEALDADLLVDRNPYLKCFEVPISWNAESLQKMRTRLSCKDDAPLRKIAVIPSIFSKIRREYVLFELECLVLEQLKGHPMKLSNILNELISKDKSEEKSILWIMEIRLLLNEGLLIPYYHNIN